MAAAATYLSPEYNDVRTAPRADKPIYDTNSKLVQSRLRIYLAGINERNDQDNIRAARDFVNDIHCFDNYFDKEIASISVFKNKPCPELCINYLNYGNQYLNGNEYRHSILCYNASLAYSPKGNSTYTKSYENRSVVLFILGYFQDSINDINIAFNNAYPSQNKTILLLRKAACYKALKQDDKFEEILTKILLSSPQTKRESILGNIENLLKNVVPADLPKIYKSSEIPSISQGENPELPGMSNALDLIINASSYGYNYFVANKDIEAGEVLGVRPIVTHLITNLQDYNRCHHCLKLHLTLIPCDKCYLAMYCSNECQKIAHEKYHNEECIAISRSRMLPRTHLANKCEIHDLMKMTIVLIAKIGVENIERLFILKKKKGQDKIKESLAQNNINIDEIFNLPPYQMNLSDDNGKQNKFLLYEHAYKIARCFNIRRKDIFDFAEIVFKLELILYKRMYDCHAVGFDADLKKTDKHISVMEIAYIFAPILNNFKLACLPNTCYVKYDDKIVLRALSPIKQGDELTIFPSCSSCSDYDHVLRSFKKKYYQSCNCIICTNRGEEHQIYKTKNQFIQREFAPVMYAFIQKNKYNFINCINSKLNEDIIRETIDRQVKVMLSFYNKDSFKSCEKDNEVQFTIRQNMFVFFNLQSTFLYALKCNVQDYRFECGMLIP